MIEKTKRPKKIPNQDNKQPQTIEQLIKRYDLDNTKIYDFLDELVESLNKQASYSKEEFDELSAKLDAKTNRAAINTAISKIGLANGSSVTTNGITVEKTGLYAVNFIIQMCGASQITNVGAYFTLQLLVNNVAKSLHSLDSADTIVAPIPKVWNYATMTTAYVSLNEGDVVNAKFTNNTGVATNDVYNSKFGIRLIKVSE